MARKKKLTGIEVGKLFIQDLLVEWNTKLDAAESGKKPKGKKLGLFTPEERESMFKQLSSDEDLFYYRIFVRIHDTISIMPKRFTMYKDMLEVRYWRICSQQLYQIAKSESEYQTFYKSPRIMTAAQHKRHIAEKPGEDLQGVAILQEPCIAEWIDGKGEYIQPEHQLILEDRYAQYKNQILKYQNEMIVGLRECFVMREAAKVLAELLGIVEIETAVLRFEDMETPLALIERYNSEIDQFANSIERYTASGKIDKKATEKARSMAKELFQPIEIDKAKPTQENIEAAKVYISEKLSNLYANNADGFYKVLRGM